MTFRNLRSRPTALLACLTLALAVGCHDINTAKDDRTGRGSGDQLPAQGPGAMGTNATTNDLTIEGPGSRVLAGPKVSAPGQSTPYGGSGAGVSPPVTPAKGTGASGDSNSGRESGKASAPGADASTEGAKPGAGASGPGTGTPPR